jgi:Co/Zn/Cd efflux system component
MLPAAGILSGMHQINGVRDPATSFPLDVATDDAGERRQANRAVAISALGLAVTGLVELSIALVSGSVALLGDALHNLSDVSTSALVFVGFRASRRLPTERYPYGYERAEDLAGIGVALVIWGSALVAGFESVNKLLRHGSTGHVGWGIAAAAVGIAGNQLAARYKLTVGRRIRSATMVADAKHSWLDALSSAGAMLGLTGVAVGWAWADAVAGIVVTGFICHVGWEVTADIAHPPSRWRRPGDHHDRRDRCHRSAGCPARACSRPLDGTDTARRGGRVLGFRDFAGYIGSDRPQRGVVAHLADS